MVVSNDARAVVVVDAPKGCVPLNVAVALRVPLPLPKVDVDVDGLPKVDGGGCCACGAPNLMVPPVEESVMFMLVLVPKGDDAVAAVEVLAGGCGRLPNVLLEDWNAVVLPPVEPPNVGTEAAFTFRLPNGLDENDALPLLLLLLTLAEKVLALLAVEVPNPVPE